MEVSSRITEPADAKVSSQRIEIADIVTKSGRQTLWRRSGRPNDCCSFTSVQEGPIDAPKSIGNFAIGWPVPFLNDWGFRRNFFLLCFITSRMWTTNL
jgi:hypothetical protein